MNELKSTAPTDNTRLILDEFAVVGVGRVQRVKIRNSAKAYQEAAEYEAEKKFWGKVIGFGDGCWFWNGETTEHGYGRFHIAKLKRQVLAHRLAWMFVYGPIPEGLWILHRCDSPRCVNPTHLRVGTAQQNTAEMIAKGRNNQGGQKFGKQPGKVGIVP